MMKDAKKILTIAENKRYQLISKCLLGLLICLTAVAGTPGALHAQEDWPQVISSKDGNPISFEICGAGDPTLIFVHGWSCDARYWRKQVPYFSKQHRVVTIDLAGHGHSGSARTKYTMNAFGEDVAAVAKAINSKNVILIGHSMGGSVIAEAARLMPDQVVGLIGVDTLENLEYPITQKEIDQMTVPMKADFNTGSRQFVSQMISPKTDPVLREWILADMSSAPPAVALSALNEMMTLYLTGEAAKVFEEIPIPVFVVNADLWPINYEANRRHMSSFDAIVMKDSDHFLMMNRAEDFNKELESAIAAILQKQSK